MDDDCPHHRIPLVIDAIRGPVCDRCDAESDAAFRALWRRLLTWLFGGR